jgi:predicted nicotinamide N-methyase
MDFKTTAQDIKIGEEHFTILSVTNFDELYDRLIEKGMEHEDVADERIPYWAELWPSAVGLATHLIKNKSSIAGKTVLEIGGGLGLPALVAAYTGATVTATDYLQDAVDFAQRNAGINNISTIQFRTFDWRSAEGYERFDILLASDVAYERSQFDHLLQAFAHLIKPDGLILLSEPNRYIAVPFIESLIGAGYDFEKYSYDVEAKNIRSKVSVYEIKRWPGK